MPILPVTDLNLKTRICEASQEFILGVNHLRRQISVCAIDGASSDPYFSTDRQTLRWRLQGSNLFLPRSVLLYGVCTTHLSREPSRYRSLLSSTTLQVISSGDSFKTSISQYPSQCEQHSRLEDLCRLCSKPDHNSQELICQRTLWRRSPKLSLCARCNHYRPMPISFPMGAISTNQSCCEVTYLTRSTRQYSDVYPYQRWQNARSQYPRSADPRSRGFLCDGSWLSRLYSAAPVSPKRRLLRHSRQKQSQDTTAILATSRSHYRTRMRSDRYSHRVLLTAGLRASASQNSLQRLTNQQDTDLLNQQLRITSFDDCPTLQVPLASRAILQMDQTTSAYQELLWHLRERRQVANLDFDQRLCSSSDRQKTTQLKGQSLSTITDLELNHV